MSSMMGGKSSGGSPSGAETRQLSGMSNRFEQEARPVRVGAMNQLAGILNYGADIMGPSMGGKGYAGQPGQGGETPQQPRKLTKYDLIQAYERNDPGKASDLNRILEGMPEEFTLEDLKKASAGGLSNRSKFAWDKTLSELESTYKSGGSNLGGVSSAGGSMFLPIAQTAIERSLQSTSRNVEALKNNFGGIKGLGGDNPFAMGEIAKVKIMGDQATSQIPSRIIEQYMTNVLPLAFGQSPVAVQGLGTAANINSQNYQAQQQMQAQQSARDAQMWQSIGSALAMAAVAT